MAIIYGLLAFAVFVCLLISGFALLVLRPDDDGAEEVLRLLARHPDTEIAEQFREYLNRV